METDNSKDNSDELIKSIFTFNFKDYKNYEYYKNNKNLNYILLYKKYLNENM